MKNTKRVMKSSLRSKRKGEGEGARREKTEEEDWGGENGGGSACNKSPLNALPPTFQNHVKIASSVIDLSCWNV